MTGKQNPNALILQADSLEDLFLHFQGGIFHFQFVDAPFEMLAISVRVCEALTPGAQKPVSPSIIDRSWDADLAA